MRRLLLTALLASATPLAAASFAAAATVAAFDAAAFAAAQKAGDPILVEVTAPWCPVCAKQKPVVDKILADPAFARVKIYTVDFDSRKDVLKSMRVQQQSTLVTFQGDHELARTTGVTDEPALKAQLDKLRG